MSKIYRDDEFDLDTLLHPAQAFEHPMRVVTDPDLTLSEKRAILASWASGACAVEAAPVLRLVPGGGPNGGIRRGHGRVARARPPRGGHREAQAALPRGAREPQTRRLRPQARAERG